MPTQDSLLKLDKMLRGLRDLHNPETLVSDVQNFAALHMDDAGAFLDDFRAMQKALRDISYGPDVIPSPSPNHGTAEQWRATTMEYGRALEKKKAIAMAALYGKEG